MLNGLRSTSDAVLEGLQASLDYSIQSVCDGCQAGWDVGVDAIQAVDDAYKRQFVVPPSVLEEIETRGNFYYLLDNINENIAKNE
eukprot:Pgem_evm1s13642